MNRASIEEALSLLVWLRDRGHERVGVAGYSMGGAIAGHVAVRAPFAVALVCAATGTSCATIYTRNLLGRQVLWDRMGDPDEAKGRLGAFLDRMSFDLLPLPLDPVRARLVGCSRDGYVDRERVISLHRHWTGSLLTWVDTGHVGGILMKAAAIRDAILDVFELGLDQATASSI